MRLQSQTSWVYLVSPLNGLNLRQLYFYFPTSSQSDSEFMGSACSKSITDSQSQNG